MRDDDLVYLPFGPWAGSGPASPLPIEPEVLYFLCAAELAVGLPFAIVAVVEICLTTKVALFHLFISHFAMSLSVLCVVLAALLFPWGTRIALAVFTFFLFATMLQVWLLAFNFFLKALMLPNMAALFGPRRWRALAVGMGVAVLVTVASWVVMAAVWDWPDRTAAIVAWRIQALGSAAYLILLFGSLAVVTRRFKDEYKKLNRERTLSVQAQLRRNRRVQMCNQNLQLVAGLSLWLLHATVLPGFYFLLFVHLIFATGGSGMATMLFVPEARLAWYSRAWLCARRRGPSSPMVASARRSALAVRKPDTTPSPTRLETMLAGVADGIQRRTPKQETPPDPAESAVVW